MYITYLLLVATIVISAKAFNDDSLKRKLMFNPHDVVHYKKWYRTVSHAFVHADAMHLGFNMFVLYMFAVQSTEPPIAYIPEYQPSLEPALVYEHGAKGYLYFACLYLGGILFSTLLAFRKHSDNPAYNSLGASGAVMAVVFGAIMLNPTMEMGLLFIPFYIPAYIFGPILLVFEYYMAKRGGGRIAHDAHFAGAIFGVIFIIIVDYEYLLKFIDKVFG